MSTKIQLFQNDRVWTLVRDSVWDLVDREHQSGMAQNSQLVKKLESRLAERFNRKHCITTANCTDALEISLRALRLPNHSKVAVSNYTFTASAHAIARAGHLVKSIDVQDNYCADVAQSDDAEALIAVDVFGNMTDLTNVRVPVIVDAAQSLESSNGTWSAGRGLISCVSFSPSKTISSWGSGGAILTDDDNIADLCRKLRLHGKSKNDDIAIAPGLNSMLSTVEAACIWAGLDLSEAWQQRRKDIADYLIKESQYPTGLDTSLAQHTYHKLVFQSADRDQVLSNFSLDNIDCVVHYRRLITDENIYYQYNKLTNSERLRDISFTVPNQHTLTDEEVERIAKVLR